ncbi:MAG: 30S ribosomal protein S19 [Bacteroidota bacterium]
MARSIKKGPYVPYHLLKKIEKATERKDPRPIKTYARGATITPDFVGFKFDVHNGKKFIPFFASEDTVGHKLGEFAPTRTFKGHTSKKKK